MTTAKHSDYIIFNLKSNKQEELLSTFKLPEAHIVFERARDVFKKFNISSPYFLYGMNSIKEDSMSFSLLTKNEYHLFSFLMELSLMDHIFRCYQMPEFLIGSSCALSIYNGGFDKLILKVFSGLSSPSRVIKVYNKVSDGSKTMRSYKLIGKSLELKDCLELINQKSRYKNRNFALCPKTEDRLLTSLHPFKNSLFFGFVADEAHTLISHFTEKIH